MGKTMTERELIATIGIPGAGKSTWACEQVRAARPGEVVRVNGDAVRTMLHGGWVADEVPNAQVWATVDATIRACFDNGALRVIVDATNLRSEYLRRWYLLATELDVRLGLKDFVAVPLDVAMARNAARPSGPSGPRVPDFRVRQMFSDMHEAVAVLQMIRHGINPWEPAREKGLTHRVSSASVGLTQGAPITLHRSA